MMTGRFVSLFVSLALFCRAGVAALLAGLLLGWTAEDIDARFAQRPMAEQAALVGGMLIALAVLTLMFAEAGAVGVLSFWLAVLLVAR